MKPIQVFRPAQLDDPQQPAPVSDFDLQFLAQGDSWFSVGAALMPKTTNLFDGMSTGTIAACVVNCALPGQQLRLMTNTTKAPEFTKLLFGAKSRRWAGLLVSGGGNDLIAAVRQSPANPPRLRLLATRAEWDDRPGGERYLSEAGWQTFSRHLVAVIAELLAARDSGENRGMPVVMHTYDLAVPRDAGPGLGLSPWLYPAMLDYGIPQADWAAVSQALLERLGSLLLQEARAMPERALHVIDTQGTLAPAAPTDTGATEDWENEIHPSRRGYRKLSALWQPVLDELFASTIRVDADGS